MKRPTLNAERERDERRKQETEKDLQEKKRTN